MRADKILFVDTETGGVDPLNDSLLSIGLVVWKAFNIIDYKEILINDGVLNVTSEALKINGINLDEHKKHALTSKEAIHELDKFLLSHFRQNEKVTIGGHNVNFDVNFLKTFLLHNKYDFHKRFSHRFVDTATILYYLYLSGKLKQKTISSQEAFEFFGIEIKNRHSALGDAIATAELFSILLKPISKIVKSRKRDLPSLFEDDNRNVKAP
jgi:DNA polymerase III epsilon subunit-like protein